MKKQARRPKPEDHAEAIVTGIRECLQKVEGKIRRQVRRRVWKRLWDDERGERRSVAKKRGPGGPLASSKRIVVFLGAGASVPLGFPATNGLLPAVWQGLAPGGNWKTWSGFRRTVGKRKRPIRKNRDDLYAILCSILPGLPESGTDFGGASIIDVISMLEHSIAERQSPLELPKLAARRDADGRRRSRRERGVPIVQPSLQLIRARHLLSMAINGVLQGRRQAKLKKMLATWMVTRSARAGCRVTLVSTNYDTAVEQQLFTLAELPGRRRQPKIAGRVDFGFTWRDIYGGRHAHLPNAPLAVFKLHGSLNWLRCETCGHVTINSKDRIASLDSWQVQNDYNSCDCGGLLKSLLVTPSVVRNIRDPSLLAVWNAALEDLRRADEWIFIGYSLPSEDVAIRSLLLRAFHTRMKRAKPRITVVSYEEDAPAPPQTAEDAFRKFFPRPYFSEGAYESRGVEVYVDGLGVSDPSGPRSRQKARSPKARRKTRSFPEPF